MHGATRMIVVGGFVSQNVGHVILHVVGAHETSTLKSYVGTS